MGRCMPGIETYNQILIYRMKPVITDLRLKCLHSVKRAGSLWVGSLKIKLSGIFAIFVIFSILCDNLLEIRGCRIEEFLDQTTYHCYRNRNINIYVRNGNVFLLHLPDDRLFPVRDSRPVCRVCLLHRPGGRNDPNGSPH